MAIRQIELMNGVKLPMATWPAMVIGLLVVVTLFVPSCFQKTVHVPKRAIPAFTVVRAEHLREETKAERDLDDAALTQKSELVGRVSLTALAEGEPVPKPAVTATAPVAYGNVEPVAFHADSTTAGEVSSGNGVKLLFAPTADAEGVKPLVIPAVLLKSTDVEPGGTDYLVAVSRRDRRRLLRVVARSRLLVVRRHAAPS